MATTVDTAIQLSNFISESGSSIEERQNSDIAPSNPGLAANSEPLPPKILNSALLMATLSYVSCMCIQAKILTTLMFAVIQNNH